MVTVEERIEKALLGLDWDDEWKKRLGRKAPKLSRVKSKLEGRQAC